MQTTFSLMKKIYLQSIFILLLVYGIAINNSAFAQGVQVNFNTIPTSGTVLVYAHQDDDVIWMLPWWSKSEKFIQAAMPSSPIYHTLIHNVQTFMDNHGYNISYESNWENPWTDISDLEYFWYYWNANPSYNYIALDHLVTKISSDTTVLTRSEINKMKAKLEQYIANPSVSRIITHDNWGEYGHIHHKGVNKAVRELAVKYRKDVWMLGTDGGFGDWSIPPGANITYTLANYDATLYAGIRNEYFNVSSVNNYWTWDPAFIPTGNIKYIKIVDAGVDKSNILLGQSVSVSGAVQDKPGSYIFNGVDNYMTLPGNTFPSFTIGMWVRPAQIKAMDISKMSEYPAGPSDDRSFYLQSNGRVTARIFDGQSRTVTSNTALTIGNWTHVLMTSDGSTLKIYINGSLESSTPAGQAFTGYTTPEFVLGQPQETPNYFNGQIYDVRLIDHVLSDSEIAALAGLAGVTYTINGTAGTGGTISPSGIVTLASGANQNYTITANSGNQITDVKVDNVSKGAVTSYTFTNVTASHTISATFQATSGVNIALNKPATSQSSESSGAAPAKANDSDGTNTSYWAAFPSPQWWKVDLGANYDVTSIFLRTYVDNTRYYQYNIQASVDDVTYTQIVSKTNTNIATDQGDGYVVSITARYLKVNMLYNSANVGVHIADFRVYGTLSTGVPVSYTITAGSGTGGTITPTGSVSVTQGTNKTFAVTAGSGYQIANVTVDATSLGAVSTYTFTNVTANHSISATFQATSGVNIALNKPATSQSSESTSVGPSKANDSDGTNTSYWAAFPYPKWWKVDLGNIYDLSSVVIRNYVDGTRYYRYTIEVSSDDITYTQIASKSNNNVAADAGDTYNITATGRYLRVNMTFNSANIGSHITDFRAYGTLNANFHTITCNAGTGGSISPSSSVPGDPGTTKTYLVAPGANQTYYMIPSTGYVISDVKIDNVSVGAVTSYSLNNITIDHTIAATFTPLVSIALNKPATSQSSESSGAAPAKANDSDGTNTSYWAAFPSPQWWKVDLGANYDVTSIFLRTYVDNTRYYQYNIQASVDDVTYTQIVSKTNTNIATDQGDGYVVSITARYLKVNMLYNSANVGVHIADFRVYGSLTGSKSAVVAQASTRKLQVSIPDSSVQIKSNKSLSVNIYPNPFNDEFTIRIDSPEDELFEMSVLDMNGRKIYYHKAIQSNEEIKFNEPLIHGIYLLILEGKGKRIISRITKY